MRAALVFFALLACKGTTNDDSGDTESDDTESDTEVPQALPAALQPYEADVLAWFNADDLPTGATDVTEWPSSWGTAMVAAPTGGDTAVGAPPAGRRLVEGDRSAMQFGDVGEEYFPPFSGALPSGDALTEGTVAVRFRYREASGGYEYVFSAGDFVEGSPTMLSLARGQDGTVAPEVFYLYDGEPLLTSVVPAFATWHTAVVTFSPTATTLHVDGVALPFDRAPTTAWTVSRDLHIGAMANGGNRGNVDVRELWVFSDALDDTARAAVEGHLGR